MTEKRAAYNTETSGEETPTQADGTQDFLPFEKTPAIEYVIERHGFLGEGRQKSLVVEGAVRTLTAEWTLKDGPFNSQVLRTYSQLQFGESGQRPFKCDIIIRDPETEILQGGDDLALVRIVIQRLARSLDLATTDILVQHMQDAGMTPSNLPVAPPRPRVEPGTGRQKKEEEL